MPVVIGAGVMLGIYLLVALVSRLDQGGVHWYHCGDER